MPLQNLQRSHFHLLIWMIACLDHLHQHTNQWLVVKIIIVEAGCKTLICVIILSSNVYVQRLRILQSITLMFDHGG